jgi:hypothetical protein
MTEISKWLEADEEGSFSLETEKKLPGASYELCEAAASTIKISRNRIFTTACRIPVWPFVVVVKAGREPRLKDYYRRRHAAISGCYSTPRKLRRLAGR